MLIVCVRRCESLRENKTYEHKNQQKYGYHSLLYFSLSFSVTFEIIQYITIIYMIHYRLALYNGKFGLSGLFV